MPYSTIARVDLHSMERPGGSSLGDLMASGLLAAADHLVVLRSGDPPFHVTLGVPHQAPAGVDKICELRPGPDGSLNPREADENAALYALAAFDALARLGFSVKLVIMVRPTTHDPNKILDSPYCREIFAGQTRMIFECHGSKRGRRLDLELSAGRNSLPDTLGFGRALAAATGHRYSLGVQRGTAQREALIFESDGLVREGFLELPARKTNSLVEAGRRSIPALHLEAKPRFRALLPGQNGCQPALSSDGLHLGNAIARVLSTTAALPPS